MTHSEESESRRHHFEQIKAREKARGADEDEATRVAAATVDKVMAQAAAEHKE